jgi:hypothetical protein
MRQQVPDLYLLAAVTVEFWNQLRHARGQGEMPHLDCPQHQCIGERLGDGKNTEHRIERQRLSLRPIGAADRRLERHRPLAPHLDDGTVILAGLDIRADDTLQISETLLVHARRCH